MRRTLLRKLNQIQLLTLLGARNMSRQKRVHKSLKIGSPPLRQRIAYFPVFVDTLAAELGADGGQAFVEAVFEAGYFVVVVVEVISWSVP